MHYKASLLSSRAAAANSFACSAHLVVCSRVSLSNKLSANRMSAQPKVRDDIPKSTQKVF